jgi:hypothetical protein
VITGDPTGFYHLFVDGIRTDSVTIEGDADAVEGLVAATAIVDEPAAVA